MGENGLPRLQLRRNEDRRIRQGHCWVYSNEIDTRVTPLKGLTPGALAQLCAANGRVLGLVHVNPNTLICARVLRRDGGCDFDRAVLRERVLAALRLRQRLFGEPFYRLVYGDSDALPGLVIDRHGEVFVVQTTTAGMESMLEDILAVLAELFEPQAVLLRNDASIRELEQLPGYVRVALGEMPEQIELRENGVRYRVSPASGQKTGWFYDHRYNRARLAALAHGARVLDLFCYVGGWGLQALAGGASSVLCVDSSQQALDLAAANARLNGVAERFESRLGNAFDVLDNLAAEGRRFDVLVLDPPAFIKRRRDQQAGESAYHRLNLAAMHVLEKEALLLSASCSMHLDETGLLAILRRAAHQADRSLSVLEFGGQGPDHPVHPSMPETRYLKSLLCHSVARSTPKTGGGTAARSNGAHAR